jgi:hypothetical protein
MDGGANSEAPFVTRREASVANKQNFTPDEWTKVLESIMLAGIAAMVVKRAMQGSSQTA